MKILLDGLFFCRSTWITEELFFHVLLQHIMSVAQL